VAKIPDDLTVLDFFAAHALQGLISRRDFPSSARSDSITDQALDLADLAYELADAMLISRAVGIKAAEEEASEALASQ